MAAVESLILVKQLIENIETLDMKKHSYRYNKVKKLYFCATGFFYLIKCWMSYIPIT